MKYSSVPSLSSVFTVTLISGFLAGCEEKIESSSQPVVPPDSKPVVLKKAPREEGSISRKDAPMDMLLRWDEWDSDGDGYADPSEQESMKVMLAAEEARALEEKENPPEPEITVVTPARPERETGGTNPNPLATIDTDGDGMISLAEAPDRMQQNFDRLDTNKDGLVSTEELAAIRDRSQRNRGGGKAGRDFGGREGGGKGGRRDGGGGGEPMKLTRPN